MATITFTYTYEIPDALADDIAAENVVDDSGTVRAHYYGFSALGTFVSSKRLPAIYQPSDHRITLDRTPAWVRDLQGDYGQPLRFYAGTPAWLSGWQGV